MSTELAVARLRAVADENSPYYARLGALLKEAAAREQLALDARTKMVVPYALGPSEVARLERMFNWKIEVGDYGARARVPAAVAAVGFCADMQCLVTMGNPGEAVAWVDGDVASAVAKSLGYVHVCRTHATNSLAAGYELEFTQLQRMAVKGSSVMAAGASAVIRSVVSGEKTRVCGRASECRVAAETIVMNHMKTPASLAQVVATAKQHGASAVRGWFFFSPEMVMTATGPVTGFDGTYRVDEVADRIVYTPAACPESSFSHPWRDLLSFVYNHEYVDDSGRWLVEKHGSGDGIVRYVVTKVDMPFMFPEELGVSYRVAEATRWVELSYPTRVGPDGQLLAVWRRATVRLPAQTYDKTMSALLVMDAAQLSWDTVVSVARNHNNTVVTGGDTVRRPARVWADVLQKAAGPMLASALHRRADASEVLRAGLAGVKRRMGVASAGWLCLTLEVVRLCAKEVGAYTMSHVVPAMCDLRETALREAGYDITVESCPEYIEVIQRVGEAGVPERNYGSMQRWLPGCSPHAGVIARALAWRRRVAEVVPVVPVEEPVPGEAVVEVNEETEAGASVHDELRRGLLDKLMAEQDAAQLGRVPRQVDRFEFSADPAVVEVPVPEGVEAAAQEDYDRYMPGVSVEDPEVRPYVAAVSDYDKPVSLPIGLNDAKREVPTPRVVMRCKWRAGAAGAVPRSQMATVSAVMKRNGNATEIRGLVDFSKAPTEAVKAVMDVCYRRDWFGRLQAALDNGLWMPNDVDLAAYVPKVDTAKAKKMLEEFFSVADIDMKSWLLMTKAKTKPPVDPGSAAKVALPQTILYNESPSMNALYSSMLSRFCEVFDGMLVPGVKLNARGSPSEFEMWFNSLNPVRRCAAQVHRYEGDSYNYDSSLELMARAVMLVLYKSHGFDASLLAKYEAVYGEKRAVSIMYGFVMWMSLQGVSGIFDTLWRNGFVTLAAVVVSAKLKREQVLSLAVTGDDYLIETLTRIETGDAVAGLALTFNFSAKFFSVEHMYFCSRYMVQVDGWWYWLADPLKKYESAVTALTRGGPANAVERLRERHEALVVDCRHYDDWRKLERLCMAVADRYQKTEPPFAVAQVLSAWASNRDRFIRQFSREEKVGYV